MYSFPNLESAHCSMSGSNCCLLTCLQSSQEAGKVVWYSHRFKNFPQFVVSHTIKAFDVVNKTEVDVFLELSGPLRRPKDFLSPQPPDPRVAPRWTTVHSPAYLTRGLAPSSSHQRTDNRPKKTTVPQQARPCPPAGQHKLWNTPNPIPNCVGNSHIHSSNLTPALRCMGTVDSRTQPCLPVVQH